MQIKDLLALSHNCPLRQDLLVAEYTPAVSLPIFNLGTGKSI